jgi:hypothetical protein
MTAKPDHMGSPVPGLTRDLGWFVGAGGDEEAPGQARGGRSLR